MISQSPVRRPLFRPEAVAGQDAVEGSVLRVDPRWIDMTFWAALAFFLFVIAYSILGTVGEYARGVAFVVFAHTTVLAPHSGIVATVEVSSGDVVKAGDVVARFDATVEEHNLSSATREFELEVLDRLRDPAQRNGAPLSGSYTRLELAKRRVAEQVISAPRSGVIGDVRLRTGQHVEPGDVAMSIRHGRTTPSLLVVLPGSYRPLLRRGMPVRIELAGFKRSYQDVHISELANDILGPSEIRRVLPREIADSAQLAGPMISLRADLPANTFVVDGRTFEFHEGMQGWAEVRLGTRSIAAGLLSGILGDRE